MQAMSLWPDLRSQTLNNKPSENVRIGAIELLPGVSGTNFWTFMLASFVCIGLMATLNIAQSYILVEHLGIPWSKQGALSGNLTLVTEIMSIVLIAPFGILADRIGRRPVIIIGILFVGLGYGFYPYATSAEDLYLYRILFGIGIPATAAMTATIQNDYPTDRTRGKLIGAAAIFNSIGVLVISFIIAQMPNILLKSGWDAIAAGKLAFGFGAVLCLISAVAFRYGLQGGTPAKGTERLPYRILIPSGFKAARNPRIALAYISAFTARGDVVITGLFVALWAQQAGWALKMHPGESMAIASVTIVVMNIASMAWSAIFGHIMDRINRVSAIVFAQGLAACGYLSMMFVSSPLDYAMLPAFILLGAGMTSAMMASFGVIGQEANYKERGAVTGMNGLFGSVGILVAASAGGRLFDAYEPWAPFVMMGVAQVLIFIIALVIRIAAPGPTPAESAASLATAQPVEK
jgi:MFS family permease